jgi:hypothetical protein
MFLATIITICVLLIGTLATQSPSIQELERQYYTISRENGFDCAKFIHQNLDQYSSILNQAYVKLMKSNASPKKLKQIFLKAKNDAFQYHTNVMFAFYECEGALKRLIDAELASVEKRMDEVEIQIFGRKVEQEQSGLCVTSNDTPTTCTSLTTTTAIVVADTLTSCTSLTTAIVQARVQPIPPLNTKKKASIITGGNSAKKMIPVKPISKKKNRKQRSNRSTEAKVQSKKQQTSKQSAQEATMKGLNDMIEMMERCSAQIAEHGPISDFVGVIADLSAEAVCMVQGLANGEEKFDILELLISIVETTLSAVSDHDRDLIERLESTLVSAHNMLNDL